MSALRQQLISETDIHLERDAFSEEGATYESATKAPKERFQLLDAIKVLMEAGKTYNAESLTAPKAVTLNTAYRLITLFPFGKMFPTKIYPGTDNTLAMEWVRQDIRGKLLLTIEPYKLGFIGIEAGGAFRDLGDYQLLPDAQSLPEEFKALLPPYRL